MATTPAYGPNQYLPTILGYGPQPTTTPFYPPTPTAAAAPTAATIPYGPTIANAAALPTYGSTPTMSTSSPLSPGPVPVPAGVVPTPLPTDDVTPDNLGEGIDDGTLDWNLPTLNLALKGIQSVGGLWAAWQQNKIAKEQISLSRDTTNVNLANQISAYNTALEDKTRHRASFNELSSKESDDYLASHKMANRQI